MSEASPHRAAAPEPRPDASLEPTPGTGIDAAIFPPHAAQIPREVHDEGGYRVRFARTHEELDRLLRLRFEVFNLELEEGLETSHLTGRDQDAFDLHCHHLIVEDRKTGEIIGTYRMQAADTAPERAGLYTATEFDLARLPGHVVSTGIEIGRACIHAEHRKQRVLFALWKGLATYMRHNRKRYLFGCCSLTSQDPADGLIAWEWLRRGGHLDPEQRVGPLPGFECRGPAPSEAAVSAFRIPALFGTYLRYASTVAGPPAIDRLFKTIDFFVVCDTWKLGDKTYTLFFGEPPPRP